VQSFFNEKGCAAKIFLIFLPRPVFVAAMKKNNVNKDGL
jgi:hypothetical protein